MGGASSWKRGRTRAWKDFPRVEEEKVEEEEEEKPRCEKVKRTRRWWRGYRESGGYRGSRPCNLRRDIAEANIGITHCSQPPALALNPLVLCLVLGKGHTCSVKGALVSLLIRHVGPTALRLSRPGDSSLTTEPASGSSAVTQSE